MMHHRYSKPRVQAWYSSSIKIEVRGNEIHLIAPCGEDRYFDRRNAADLIERLKFAVETIGEEDERQRA